MVKFLLNTLSCVFAFTASLASAQPTTGPGPVPAGMIVEGLDAPHFIKAFRRDPASGKEHVFYALLKSIAWNPRDGQLAGSFEPAFVIPGAHGNDYVTLLNLQSIDIAVNGEVTVTLVGGKKYGLKTSQKAISFPDHICTLKESKPTNECRPIYGIGDLIDDEHKSYSNVAIRLPSSFDRFEVMWGVIGEASFKLESEKMKTLREIPAGK